MSGFAVVWDADATAPRWSRPPATAGGWEVVADASLYYRDDLRRRFPDAPRTDDPAQLIAEALAAGGPRAVGWLEGDFAWAAWHAGQRMALVARDFGGRRPLFHACHGGTLCVATDPGTILREPSVPRGLDLATLASVAGALWGHGDATAYASIRELLAGCQLTWSPGTAPQLTRYWHAPNAFAARPPSLDDASAELRTLLEGAVRERVATTGPTAVSLSGGWDSTAVYGTGRAIGLPLHGVSISYPEGDRGREDEFIEQVTRHWGSEPDLTSIETIAMPEDLEAAARRRAHPFAHAFEDVNRVLAQRARAHGATVMLDGGGGDQLFQVGDIYLADLFRTGQWWELVRQAQARATDGQWVRMLYRWGVRPNLPHTIERAVGRLRGYHPTPHHLDRLPPPWFRRDFLVAHGVRQREQREWPQPTTRSHVLTEMQNYLTFAFYPRAVVSIVDAVRDEGVELRAPLLDARVVQFAALRPWSDRAYLKESKRLLRRAMQDRLPATVLAPRARRTGTSFTYFLRELRQRAWPVVQRVLPQMRLAELGLVDPARYRHWWQYVVDTGVGDPAPALYQTLQVELWLRTHLA